MSIRATFKTVPAVRISLALALFASTWDCGPTPVACSYWVVSYTYLLAAFHELDLSSDLCQFLSPVFLPKASHLLTDLNLFLDYV